MSTNQFSDQSQDESSLNNNNNTLITITDIMSNTTNTTSLLNNSNQLLIYLNIRDDDSFINQFKILNIASPQSPHYQSHHFNILQIIHCRNIENLILLLIETNNSTDLYYIHDLNYEINLNDIIQLNDKAITKIGSELFENGMNEIFGLKKFPFKFRKNEKIIKIDKSGNLIKTNFNTIWDMTGSMITIKENQIEHLIFENESGNDLKVLNEFNDEIIEFDSYGHNVFLTKNGKLYGYGYNTYRQLNLDGEDDNVIDYISDISFGNEFITKVIPGPYKTHFITKNGKLYASGENSEFLIGCSEGKTRSEIYEHVISDNGTFHSYPACECDLLKDYKIKNVYPIGMGVRCIFETFDKKLVICGGYQVEINDCNATVNSQDEKNMTINTFTSTNHKEIKKIISIGDIYQFNDEIDQLHILAEKYLLIITKNRKLHVIGRRYLEDDVYNKNWLKRFKREELIFEQICSQIEILLNLDEKIYGKLEIIANQFDFGIVFKLEMSTGLFYFFKSLKYLICNNDGNSKNGKKGLYFSDLTFVH